MAELKGHTVGVPCLAVVDGGQREESGLGRGCGTDLRT